MRKIIRRIKSQLAIATAAGAVAAMAVPTSAADGTWTSTASGSWSDTANWSGGVVADAGAGIFNTVDVPATDITVTVDSPRSLTTLTFGDTATATNGKWILSDGGNALNTLTLSGATSLSSGSVSLTGTLSTTNFNLSTGNANPSPVFSVDGGTLTSTAQANVNAGTNSSRFILNSGAATFTGGIRTSNNDGGLIQVNGGTFSATNVTVQRSVNFGSLPAAASSTNGFIFAGGTGNVTILDIGTGNSSASSLVSGGSLTVSGEARIGSNNTGRFNVLQVSGGSFTSTDVTNGILLNRTATGTTNAGLLLTGGTTTAEKISFGLAPNTAAGSGNVVLNGGALYMGSGGFVKNNTTTGYAANINLTSGTLGAKANWSTSLPMNLNGSSVTIKAADASDNPFDIALNGAISGAGTINKTGGGTLTLGGANWNGVGAYNANITVNAGNLTVDTTAGGGSYGGVISGAGSFTKTGSNSLTLSSPQAYSGATAVAGGTLAINGTQATSGVAVQSGATLALAGNASVNALTLGGAAGDAQTLRVNTGSAVNNLNVLTTDALVAHGTTTIDVGSIGLSPGLYPVLDYNGTIGGSGGTFALGTLPPRVTANLVHNTGSTSFALDVTGVDFPRWTGAVDGNWDIGTVDGAGTPTSGTANWKEVTSGNTTIYLQASAPGDQVIFDDSATGTTSVNIVAPVSPALVTVNNLTKNYTFSGAAISGPGQLIKQGTGTLTLSNTGSDYTGGTSIQGGTLALGAANALPTAGSVAVSGGTLDLGGLSQDLSGSFNLNGGTIANGTVNKSGANYTLSSGTVSANLAGAVGADKTSGGTVIFTGASTYTGVTTVAAGTLQLGDGTSNGSVAGNITNNGTVIFNNGTDQTWANNITGVAGTVIKEGPGTLTVTGINDGTTVLNAGTTVVVGANTNTPRLARDGSVTVNNGATLLLQGINGLGVGSPTAEKPNWVLNAGGTIRIDAGAEASLYGGVLAGGTLTGVGGTAGLRSDYTAAAGTSSLIEVSSLVLNNGVTFTVPGDASVHIASNVSGNSGLELDGGGMMTLSGANTYTGGTTLNAGTVVVANGDALGTGGLTVNNATARAQAGLPKSLSVATLTTVGTGKLDLTDNDLVIKTSTLAAVQAQITAGFNGGTWDGAGINSSAAATHPNATTALGYGDNAELGLTTFSGVALTGPEIIVKYTYYGDADLTGVVDLDDFGLFLTGYQNGNLPRTWIYGDFDYTGVIDLDDFGLFLYGYQNQGGPLGALSEAVADASGVSSSDRAFMQSAIAAVPEPASLAVLGLAGLGLLRRRCRRPAACD